MAETDYKALADRARTASTWVAGPRRVELLKLAEEIAGASPATAEKRAQEALAAEREKEKPRPREGATTDTPAPKSTDKS